MKERDPFTGSLFERPSSGSVASSESKKQEDAGTNETIVVAHAERDISIVVGGRNSDEIFALLKKRQPGDPERFCMVHMKFEPDVAIYIAGKRALFLCPAIAEQRGAWKWEGKWPQGK